MSATGRSVEGGYEREPDDYYRTPAWCTRAILRELRRDLVDPHALHPDLRLLDPCCGTGAILEAARTHDHYPRPIGIETHPGRADEARRQGFKVKTCDALKVDWPDADVIVQNPPFSFALHFIQAGLAWLHEDREMAVLLRLCFMASAKRSAFWKANPADLFVLSSRPSFCLSVKCVSELPPYTKGCGWHVTLDADAERPVACPECGGKVRVTASDAADYGWFVWGPTRTGRWQVLEGTP